MAMATNWGWCKGESCSPITTCYDVAVYIPAPDQGVVVYERTSGAGVGQTGTLVTPVWTDDFYKYDGRFYIIDRLNGTRTTKYNTVITIPPVGTLVADNNAVEDWALTPTPIQFRTRTWNNSPATVTIGGDVLTTGSTAWQYTTNFYTPNATVQEIPVEIEFSTVGTQNDYSQIQIFLNGAWRQLEDTWFSSTGGAAIVYRPLEITLNCDGSKTYILNNVLLSDPNEIADLEQAILDGLVTSRSCTLPSGAYGLSIEKSADNNTPEVNDVITYIVVVTNSGMHDAMVKVTDIIQSPLVYVVGSVSATASDGTALTIDSTDPSGQGINITTDTPLGSGENITLVYQGEKSSSGDIFNQALAVTHYNEPTDGVKASTLYSAFNNSVTSNQECLNTTLCANVPYDYLEENGRSAVLAGDGTLPHQFYLMFSEQPIRDRWSGTSFHGFTTGNFVMVYYDGTDWQYDYNNGFSTFTPVASDRLLLGIDYINDTSTTLTQTNIDGIDVAKGVFTIIPNQMNGSPNNGEWDLDVIEFQTEFTCSNGVWSDPDGNIYSVSDLNNLGIVDCTGGESSSSGAPALGSYFSDFSDNTEATNASTNLPSNFTSNTINWSQNGVASIQGVSGTAWRFNLDGTPNPNIITEVLDLSPALPDNPYAHFRAAEQLGAVADVYVTDDGGSTWTLVPELPVNGTNVTQVELTTLAGMDLTQIQFKIEASTAPTNSNFSVFRAHFGTYSGILGALSTA